MLSKILIRIGIVLLVLILAYVLRLIYLIQNTPAAADFGTARALTVCATSKPNCVSSLNTEAGFKAKPIAFSIDATSALAKLKAAIQTEPNSQVVFENAQQVDVTFKTALFGFRDDASFAVNLSSNRIEFRSQSRVGYSDLGVNRKRIERIRAAFDASK